MSSLRREPGPESWGDSHIDEDLLELYSMNRLTEETAAPVEEHLLVCSECRSRLDAPDSFIRETRSALRILNRRDQ
jgi:predicted anti-sigma-YlaC factor YlaD